tara:strand:- start:1560 stop:2273 length:714 start_codon:yes stop_codon:yes gene_type:complete
MIFKRKVFLKDVDSTSDYLIRLDNKISLDEGLVVVSDFQNKGRGRIGKTWHSDCGKNLLFSFILKPTGIPIKKQFFLSMISSIAIVDALKKHLSEKINIKWPNDILINNKKIAGFLLDLSVSSNSIKRCVIGCGININQKQFSQLNDVTSIILANNHITEKKVVLDDFLQYFSKLYTDLINEKYSEIKSRYLSSAKDFVFTKSVNGKKSEIQVLNISEEGFVLALVDNVPQKLKNIF